MTNEKLKENNNRGFRNSNLSQNLSDLKDFLNLLEESFDKSKFANNHYRKISVAPKNCWSGCYISNEEGEHAFWTGLIIGEGEEYKNRIVFQIFDEVTRNLEDLKYDQWGNAIINNFLDLNDEFVKKSYVEQKSDVIKWLNEIYKTIIKAGYGK